MQSFLIPLLLLLSACALSTLAFPVLATLGQIAIPNSSQAKAKKLSLVGLGIISAVTLVFALQVSFTSSGLNKLAFYACAVGATVIAGFVAKEGTHPLFKWGASITITVIPVGSLLCAFFFLFEDIKPESTTLAGKFLCQRSGYGMAGSDAGVEIHVSQHFGILRKTVAYARISDYDENSLAMQPKLIRECAEMLDAKAINHIEGTKADG